MNNKYTNKHHLKNGQSIIIKRLVKDYQSKLSIDPKFYFKDY